MHDLVKGLSILKEFSPRSQDAMAAYGELLSSAILAAGLESRGVKVQLLDSRTLMITDDHFTAAEPIEETAQARMRAALLPELERGRTPVMQGYIGATLAGATTTLGFEGSDFTASFVGAALDVKAIQIWKDVPGLMSADPAVIPEAQTIPAATCDEMAELTYFGAKLLHPRAVWPAAQKRIPVQILNSWQPARRRDHHSRKRGDRSARSALHCLQARFGVASRRLEPAAADFRIHERSAGCFRPAPRYARFDRHLIDALPTGAGRQPSV